MPTPPALRVLVVDDNVDAADSLAMLLRLPGHEARVAYDGPAAVALAQSFRPALVLLDLGMPGMSGAEVARRLRQLPGAGRLLVVCVSGFGDEQARRLSAEAGCDRHLLKPVDLDELQRLLAEASAVTA
jgi:CheY-like chemotaxis protein